MKACHGFSMLAFATALGGILSLLSALASASTDPAESIWGKWRFSQILDQGELEPIPNPRLVLTFEFRPDGTDHLHWSRKGEEGSCEREGRYRYDGAVLHDEVVSVDPRNEVECARDPDMVLGHVSDTPLSRVGAKLQMDLGLGDRAFYYIFERL